MVFDLRPNEDRMKQLGKSVSTRSKQYRIKRIDINVKINVLAYSVEVLGGLLLGCFSLVHPATFLYIGVEICTEMLCVKIKLDINNTNGFTNGCEN